MSNIHDVYTVNQAFYRAFEKKDIDAMSSIWSTGNASLCIHPGRNILKGWLQIQHSWKQIFENTQYLEINIDIISSEMHGNLAYIVLTESLLQVVRGQRIESQTLATNIFEHTAQRWYLIHHHGSPMLR
jgi:ketosteroid isomerase-like protein